MKWLQKPLANSVVGLIGADAEADSHLYPVVIDAGAGYTWWHGGVVQDWLALHPD